MSVIVQSGAHSPGLSGLLRLMNGAATARLVIATVAFDQAARAICVLRSHPVGQGLVRPVLSPSLRRRVEIPVHAEEFFTTPSVGRVGVEDLAGAVPDEHAVAREVL